MSGIERTLFFLKWVVEWRKYKWVEIDYQVEVNKNSFHPYDKFIFNFIITIKIFMNSNNLSKHLLIQDLFRKFYKLLHSLFLYIYLRQAVFFRFEVLFSSIFKTLALLSFLFAYYFFFFLRRILVIFCFKLI